MQQFQELRERTIDLLIVRMPRPFLEEDLVAEMLFDEPFQAIAGARSRWAGFLEIRSPETITERLRAFRQGLKETGYVESENVAIEYRWADGQFDRMRELAADLVNRQVSVIAVPGSAAGALAAKAATQTIPIAFAIPEDPVRLGLVASLARPGGNLTGLNFFVGELVAKRLDLLRELLPSAARVAVLINPASPAAEITMRDAEVAARALGLQIQVLRASTSREINVAFATFVNERPDAVFVGGDPFFNDRRIQLANLASYHRVPATYSNRDLAEAGGLMSYGTNITDFVSYRRYLHRPRPQGCQACRPAGCAGVQIRVGDQRPDRQDARPRSACNPAHPRRRSDRVSHETYCVPLHHSADAI